jgi:hypothetical protein
MMAAQSTIKVEGVKELRASLKRLGVGLNDLKQAHVEVGNLVGRRAAQDAPKRSGRLAGTMRPGGAATQAVVRFGGARVPYANAVHWGTGARPGKRGPHNIRRNPFAWQAAQDTQGQWEPIYNAAVDDLLAHVKGASTA